MPFEIQRRAAAFYAKTARKVLSMPRDEWSIDAYAWDHDGGITLSPIESYLWGDIRQCNMVLYPQWPVAGFFVDFGNPVAKVAIECDGKAYHDPDRDRARQKVIESHGWAVYRFPGWLCARDTEYFFDEEGNEQAREGECIRKLRGIGEAHGIIRTHKGTGRLRSLGELIADRMELWAKESQS